MSQKFLFAVNVLDNASHLTVRTIDYNGQKVQLVTHCSYISDVSLNCVF